MQVFQIRAVSKLPKPMFKIKYVPEEGLEAKAPGRGTDVEVEWVCATSHLDPRPCELEARAPISSPPVTDCRDVLKHEPPCLGIGKVSDQAKLRNLLLNH